MSAINSAEEVTIADEGKLSNSAIKSKIVSGEFKINNKRGKSKIWNVFGKIDNASGEELPQLVACRICKNVYKYNHSATSNLVRHKCYIDSTINDTKISKVEVDAATKKKTIQILTEWSIENCRPFKIVADSGFEKVGKHLVSVGARYGPNVDLNDLLPHPTTISRNIGKVYKNYFEKIKSEIAQIKSVGFGLTSDLWTDDFLKKTYISLTVHYVKDATLISRLLGMKSMEGEKCTSNYSKSTKQIAGKSNRLRLLLGTIK